MNLAAELTPQESHSQFPYGGLPISALGPGKSLLPPRVHPGSARRLYRHQAEVGIRSVSAFHPRQASEYLLEVLAISEFVLEGKIRPGVRASISLLSHLGLFLPGGFKKAPRACAFQTVVEMYRASQPADPYLRPSFPLSNRVGRLAWSVVWLFYSPLTATVSRLAQLSAALLRG